MLDAVVFDMDGVIIDSEPVWQQVRVDFVAEHGEVWTPADGDACRGRESEVWSTAVSERIDGRLSPRQVFDEILERMLAAYKEHLPVFDGAVEAIEAVATKYPVAVASGSPRPLIDTVLEVSGLDQVCTAVGYGDEVDRGKPAPDVYLDVLDRMGARPAESVGVEDSVSGIQAVLAAGMRLIAVISPDYRLPEDLAARAEVRVPRLADLTLEMIETLPDR